MGHRRQARELALQILFQMEFNRNKLKPLLQQFWEENACEADIREFAETLVEGTLRNLKEVDALIENSSTNWKLNRMAAVDRNLLRQAAYEILYLKEIPASVTINEAIEIAKKFGTEESPSFVNGVLDKISKMRNDQS